MANEIIGVIANPASGKDVRRLVARASIFDNREKGAIIDRAVIGAVNAGARQFAYVDDSHNITHSAMQHMPPECDVIRLPSPNLATSIDTVRGAAELERLGCLTTLILGGDGTCRAFVKGWREAVLLPLSTGTNNVFPQLSEATIAGAALGVIAAGGVALDEVMTWVKIIDIDIEDEAPDLALIDAVVTNDRFVGARALLDVDALKQVLLTRAEPAGIGMTALGGLLMPISEVEDCGLHLTLGKLAKEKLHAPIAPGLFKTLGVKSVNKVNFDEPIAFEGPCMLALDGERERVIRSGQRVTMRVSRSGPKTINIEKTMQLAATRRLFRR